MERLDEGLYGPGAQVGRASPNALKGYNWHMKRKDALTDAVELFKDKEEEKPQGGPQQGS